jgi:hypothetical protein
MSLTVTPVDNIQPIARSEAQGLAALENERVLDVLRSLTDDEWSRPTDCSAWDVRTLAGHVLGAMEGFSAYSELIHMMRAAKREAGRGSFVDGMTTVQVRERAFTLELAGAAGGTFARGAGGETISIDAVEFCRILSGRATATGLLAQEVPF